MSGGRGDRLRPDAAADLSAQPAGRRLRGLGSVGIQFPEQDGTVITFTFSAPLCAGTTSYFFDVAATNASVSDNATLFGYGSPPIGRLQSAALS